MLNEIEQRVNQLLNAGGRQILGIVGAPASGKSTLTEQIAEHYGDAVVIVPMDGYHLANRELARIGLANRKGSPPTFDVQGYVSLLQRIRNQTADEIVYAPTFERSIEEAIASSIPVLPQTKLIVTEGNYLLLDSGGWQQVRSLLDACWYVDVDNELRLSRLIARHVEFGRTLEAAKSWVESNDELNARLIEVSKHRADWLIPMS